MEQLTKNQAVATSQEAVQNQNEPQLRDENAHNDKSVHGVLNPTYQAGLRRDAVQPDIEAERKKRDEIDAGKSYCSRRFFFNDTATTEIYTLSLHDALPISSWRHSIRSCSGTGGSRVPISWPRRIARCAARVRDRKSTRLNSSHSQISYAVFCLKKKKSCDRFDPEIHATRVKRADHDDALRD